MTIDTLSKAKDLDNQIKSLVKAKKTLHSPYINVFRFIDFRGDKETTETLTVDDELKNIVDNYLSEKIDRLQKEFEKL